MPTGTRSRASEGAEYARGDVSDSGKSVWLRGVRMRFGTSMGLDILLLIVENAGGISCLAPGVGSAARLNCFSEFQSGGYGDEVADQVGIDEV